MLCVSRRSSLKEWSKSDRAALGPEQAEPCQWVGLFEVSCRACNTKSRSERPVTPNLSPELNTPSASFSSRFVSTSRHHSSESVPSDIMKSTRSSRPLMTRSSVASPPRFLMPEGSTTKFWTVRRLGRISSSKVRNRGMFHCSLPRL